MDGNLVLFLEQTIWSKIPKTRSSSVQPTFFGSWHCRQLQTSWIVKAVFQSRLWMTQYRQSRSQRMTKQSIKAKSRSDESGSGRGRGGGDNSDQFFHVHFKLIWLDSALMDILFVIPYTSSDSLTTSCHEPPDRVNSHKSGSKPREADMSYFFSWWAQPLPALPTLPGTRLLSRLSWRRPTSRY